MDFLPRHLLTTMAILLEAVLEACHKLQQLDSGDAPPLAQLKELHFLTGEVLNHTDSPLTPHEQALLEQNRKIDVVRSLRARTGLSLKHSLAIAKGEIQHFQDLLVPDELRSIKRGDRIKAITKFMEREGYPDTGASFELAKAVIEAATSEINEAPGIMLCSLCGGEGRVVQDAEGRVSAIS